MKPGTPKRWDKDTRKIYRFRRPKTEEEIEAEDEARILALLKEFEWKEDAK